MDRTVSWMHCSYCSCTGEFRFVTVVGWYPGLWKKSLVQQGKSDSKWESSQCQQWSDREVNFFQRYYLMSYSTCLLYVSIIGVVYCFEFKFYLHKWCYGKQSIMRAKKDLHVSQLVIMIWSPQWLGQGRNNLLSNYSDIYFLPGQ